MTFLGFENMAHDRQMAVGRVKQPEVGNIRGGEFRQALILLPARSRKRAALGGEDLDQARTQNGH